MLESQVAPPRRDKPRLLFPALVQEVALFFHDGRAATMTIEAMGEATGEHPWRIVDAIETIHMLGYR